MKKHRCKNCKTGMKPLGKWFRCPKCLWGFRKVEAEGRMSEPWFCECGWKGNLSPEVTEYNCPDCGGYLSEDYGIED